MPSGFQCSIKFDGLRSPLFYDFPTIQGESDPYKKLAWLLGQHESIMQQLGKESKLPVTLGLSRAPMLIQDYQRILREYHELRCEKNFPHELISEGLDDGIICQFLNVLGENEKNDPYFGFGLSKDKRLDEIENWLGSRRAWGEKGPPICGLVYAINELRDARNRLNDPTLNQGDITGQVILAFNRGERLLRQLISFYARAFYGQNYKDAILNQYNLDAHNKGRKLPAEARRFRDEKEIYFSDHIEILHRLDQWIVLACKPMQIDYDEDSEKHPSCLKRHGRDFELVFQKKRLLPSQSEIGSTISIPVKDGDRIMTQSLLIEEYDASPFIEILRRLNRLRRFYVHVHGSQKFQRLSNLKNFHEGAKEILDTFIKLWETYQYTIFPSVVIVRRILQTETNLVRLDLVPERGPSLESVRVIAKSLPPYATQLLGREAYMMVHAVESESGVVSSLSLYLLKNRFRR